MTTIVSRSRLFAAPLFVAIAVLALVVGPIADASTVINGATPGAFGSTPALTGAIRLSNATQIKERNSTNSADLNLIGLTNSTTLQIGDTGISSPSSWVNGSHVTIDVSSNSGANITLYTLNILTMSGGTVNLGNHDQVTVGTHGVGMQFASPTAIAIGAGGTFTLSAGQYQDVINRLTGSLTTSNAVVIVPDFPGHYEFALDGLTSTTGTLQFENASGAVCPAAVIGASLANTLAIVYVDASGTTNTISCNY